MLSPSVGFSSVKLPAALVQQAREAAQPLRRSVAGQVEYWATLGQIVEHSGLTAQEARAAIEGHDAARRQAQKHTLDTGDAAMGLETLEAIKMRVVAASTSGLLQSHIQKIVKKNSRQATQPVVAPATA